MSIKSFKTLVDAIGTGTALLHEYRMATAVRWSLEHWSILSETTRAALSPRHTAWAHKHGNDVTLIFHLAHISMCEWVSRGSEWWVSEWPKDAESERGWVRVSESERVNERVGESVRKSEPIQIDVYNREIEYHTEIPARANTGTVQLSDP